MAVVTSTISDHLITGTPRRGASSWQHLRSLLGLSQLKPLTLRTVVTEMHLSRRLEKTEQWALNNARPLSPEEFSMFHLMFRNDMWRRALGRSTNRFILDVFLGLKPVETEEQQQALQRFASVMGDYLSGKDERWSEINGTVSIIGQSPFRRISIDHSKRILDALDGVLLAWGKSPTKISPAPNLTYIHAEHHFSNSGQFLLPGNIMRSQWGDVPQDMTWILFASLSSVFSPHGETMQRFLSICQSVYSEEELSAIARFAQCVMESSPALRSLAPHCMEMNWSNLLELSQLAEEYNMEWALAGYEWSMDRSAA